MTTFTGQIPPPPIVEDDETLENKPLLRLPGSRPRGRKPIEHKPPIPPLKKGLSDKHFVFCREYVVDRVGTRAVIAAGYSANTASVKAAQLLRHPEIRAEIARLTAVTAHKLDLSAEAIDRELMKIAFYDVQADIEKYGRCWMKATDKIRALELLGKRLNLFQDQIQIDVTSLTDEERLERARALESKVKARILSLAVQRAGAPEDAG